MLDGCHHGAVRFRCGSAGDRRCGEGHRAVGDSCDDAGPRGEADRTARRQPIDGAARLDRDRRRSRSPRRRCRRGGRCRRLALCGLRGDGCTGPEGRRRIVRMFRAHRCAAVMVARDRKSRARSGVVSAAAGRTPLEVMESQPAGGSGSCSQSGCSPASNSSCSRRSRSRRGRVARFPPSREPVTPSGGGDHRA